MNTAIVVTSISSPNDALRALANGSQVHGWKFYVIGDRKSPPSFDLPGAEFVDLATQATLPFRYAASCPVGHYARKNIGYLLAAAGGAEIIVETDDDNLPSPDFFSPRQRQRNGLLLTSPGWVNVYRYFTRAHIWPRGLPLGEIKNAIVEREKLPRCSRACAIQQGLADGSPDVDAIYRLADLGDVVFDREDDILLSSGAWCPFNSQNTTWFREVFRLLYLPACCSFRMTDIWRSFVALSWLQRSGGTIAYHQSTVFQKRNAHDLERDLLDEVPGYVNNRAIKREIDSIQWTASQAEFLRAAYSKMTDRGWVGAEEEALLDAWLHDADSVCGEAWS